jgi:hypothetical protein
MCRSIHRLREGITVGTDEDVRAASLQFVRKVSGFSKPTARHQAAFDVAVAEISASVERLLDSVVAEMAS